MREEQNTKRGKGIYLTKLLGKKKATGLILLTGKSTHD